MSKFQVCSYEVFHDGKKSVDLTIEADNIDVVSTSNIIFKNGDKIVAVFEPTRVYFYELK